jgi:hypothetical protein
MFEYLLSFLKALEDQIPPPLGCHHSIHCGSYGSDLTGWQDKLCLTLVPSEKNFKLVFFDPVDLGKPIEQLVNEVHACINGARMP